ncbi:uncharacterized protein cubi_01262 [Cryptosporidium ubiquitum]|uniref:MMS19 N-terminal domain-containing protein n=1 Tax=Cryptosporidium ubiquitum TaxID=857276 RepID=A0A1J4MDT4_9CRYT|nr:uncharacterized protein cubi_01262 [Cryptosporidium ubiquitum]OII72382.1 hypothetical protein cubi_01262 [Cryptosporidium ubiquitum]
MEFEITIANCISCDKLDNDDIEKISTLLTKKQISVEDLIVSLEAELVSPIVSQKKRGIEIIEQVLWNYLPNEDFTAIHIKLICCFVLNYISDWACVDSVIGIFKCIFSSQDFNLLKNIKIDIRDDENIKDEYCFNPIIKLNNEFDAESSDLGPGKIINEGGYFKSYTEICSYHKFINHFNIEDVQNDDELYKMSIVFYLITQALYRISTRQLIYSSRIKIIDFFLFIFSEKKYYSELIRLGPGIVPIVIQHIENEKDPRVLIKAFPLIQYMIENFQEIISLYDNQHIKNSLTDSQNKSKQEYDTYQLYTGRIPKLSDEEKKRLELIYSSNNLEENEETCEESSGDLFYGSDNGILSNLISEVLFSYFPLQFQSSSNQLPRTGIISPKDLKEAYFSVITCSYLTQDSLIQAITEYIDTQGLLENIINYDNSHFEDEKELEKYLDSDKINSEILNKPIHLRQADQDILIESLTLLGMIKYDLNPEIINKYISNVFLLINELLKNTVVSTEATYKLLLNIFFILINIELKFKNGQKIVNTAINQFIIPKLLLKLNSEQQLDLFAFNILDMFILTNNQAVIENIKNNFMLIDIFKNNFLERIHINSKLLITLYILTDYYNNNENFQISDINQSIDEEITDQKPDSKDSKETDNYDIDCFNLRVNVFIEKVESEEKFKENVNLENLELPKLCLFLILKYILNDYKQLINKFFQALDFHWYNFNQRTEVEKNYITGISAFLLTNNSESRAHWFSYLDSNYPVISEEDNFSIFQNSNSTIENLIYTIVKEEEVPLDMVTIFINKMINISIFDSISEKMSLDKWSLVNYKLSNVNKILNSKKWNNIYFVNNFSIKCDHWLGTLIDSISSITDYKLILENKNLFYEVSKGFGVLTYRLFKHVFESNNQNEEIMVYKDEMFEEIKSKLDKTVNCWLVFVFINEILIQILSNHVINDLLLKRLTRILSDWLNKKMDNYDACSFNSEETYRLINLEVEKLVINLLVLTKEGKNKIDSQSIENKENNKLFNYKGKNKIIYNKTLRYYLFNEIGNFENNYTELKRLCDKILQDYCDSNIIKNESKIESLYSDLFSMIYVTGSDLNLLKNPNSNDFSISIGKFKYFFSRSNESNNRAENEFQLNSSQNIYSKIISIIMNCNNNNTGKYLFELTKLKIDDFTCGGNIQNSFLQVNYTNKEIKSTDLSKNAPLDNIEELWPEVIPLTDNCYNQVNLNNPDNQEKVLRVNQIITESFADIYPLNPYIDRDSYNYPLILVPVISSMNNLNIKNIINSFSSNSIHLILMLSLIECTNFDKYEPVKLENPNLVKYLTEQTKKEESIIDLENHIKEIKKLLMCKKLSKESGIWNKSMHELQIHNLQSLSILIRILHYSRENKLMIYEKRNQNKHSLDFVLDNICVYSILVSNILENHPNTLVRFVCNLIISQIFKFPTVFRTNIKDYIVKSLTNSSNKDNNKGLRKMSSILKLKILTLNDHIY